MPTWKQNPLYGDNGWDMIADDGSIYPDPFGVVRGESDPTGVLAQTASLAPQAPAVPDVRLASNDPAAAVQALYPPQPAAAPDVKGAHAPPDPASLMGSADREFATPGAVDASGLPAQAATPGAPGAPAGGPPDPAALMGSADRTSSSTVETASRVDEQGSTGLSAADQATAQGDIAATGAARAKAADAAQATTNLEAQQAQRRSAELFTQAASAQEKIAAEQVVNDRLNAEVEAKLKAGAEFRPDRTELFHGDRGALFSISSAVAAMAGGWLMGLGKTKGNPYLDVILRLIDDNANDQIRKNSSVVQELMRQKGDLSAVKADLKARMLRVADQYVEARMLRDKSELVQTKGAETRAQMAAQDSQWQAEQRRALMRTESKKMTETLNRVTTQSTQSGGAGALNPDKQAEKLKTIRALDQQIETMRRGLKADSLSGVVGFASRNGWNAARRAIGTLPPEQVEQLNNLNDIMVSTIMSLSREPSNQMQDIIKDINIPQNDAEIPTFLTRLERIRNQAIEDYQQTPRVEVPTPTSVEAGPRR